MCRAALLLLACIQADLNVITSSTSPSMSRTLNKRAKGVVNEMGHFEVEIPQNAVRPSRSPIIKDPIVSGLVRSHAHHGKPMMELENHGHAHMAGVRSDRSKFHALLDHSVHHGAPPGQCEKADAAVNTVDNGITKDILPLLSNITFETTLTADAEQTQTAKNAAVAAQRSANNASTVLDTCLGKEKELQDNLARLTGEKDTLLGEKNTECNTTESSKTYQFRMPNSTHGNHSCTFPSSTPQKCWDSAYLAALEALELEVQGQLDLYTTSKEDCADLTSRLGLKKGEVDDAEEDLGDKKRDCETKEGQKTEKFCAFAGKIETLCEESEELMATWNRLEGEKNKKRAAIRTMKLTACVLGEHYTLGNTGCTGCTLGSKADTLGACEAKFPATDDYGVSSAEPTMVTQSKTFFGLPGLCGDVGSDDVTFPGHLWTRAAGTGGSLTKGAQESTTFTAIKAGC